MRKLIPMIIALIVLECICINASGQRKKKNEQLYRVSTEVVKSDKIEQYIQARTKLNSVLHETGFPHPFILWKSNDTIYHIWYPVKDLNELNRIEKDWEAFAERHGTDVLDPVHECVETRMDKVMLAYLQLAYEPDGRPSEEHETNFCHMKQLYLKQGSEQAVKAHINQIIELFQSKGVERNFYCGEGLLGMEIPVLIYWSFAKDEQNYLQQEANIIELMGDEYQEIHQELSHHVRKTKSLDFHYVNGLSYNIY